MFNTVEVEVEALEMRILDFGGCREDDASLKRLYFRISWRAKAGTGQTQGVRDKGGCVRCARPGLFLLEGPRDSGRMYERAGAGV
jgi:hypothetical protein